MRAAPMLGERREHYECIKDVWEMFRLIVEQRKRRGSGPDDPVAAPMPGSTRNWWRGLHPGTAQAMAEFFETGLAGYDEVKLVSPQGLRSLVKVRGKIRRLLGMESR